MTTITKQKARELGMRPYSTQFWPHEREGLEKMFRETLVHHPEARLVECAGKRMVIYIKQAPRYGKSRPDNPKAMRGNYPTVRQIVGQAI